MEPLKHLLSSLSLEFEARWNRPPRRADIEADTHWASLFSSLKDLERLAATSAAADGSAMGRRDGGCSVYIARRRRFCSHAAAGGMDVCSEHHAVAKAADRSLSHSHAGPLGETPSITEASSTSLQASGAPGTIMDQGSEMAAVPRVDVAVVVAKKDDPDMHSRDSPQGPQKPTGWAPKRNLGRRMKHCSNPLASQHLGAFVPPDWSQVQKRK